MSSKEVKAYKARAKQLQRQVDTVEAELRRVKAERDRSPLIVPGPLSAPLRALAAELGLLEEWASPIPARPEGGSRSAETPLPYVASQKAVAARDAAGQLVDLVVEKLRSDRDGTGVQIPGVCPLCHRRPPRPRRHDDDQEEAEVPPNGLRNTIVDMCTEPATKTDLTRRLSTHLDTSVRGDQVARWLRWLTINNVLEGRIEADHVVYERRQ